MHAQLLTKPKDENSLNVCTDSILSHVVPANSSSKVFAQFLLLLMQMQMNTSKILTNYLTLLYFYSWDQKGACREFSVCTAQGKRCNANYYCEACLDIVASQLNTNMKHEHQKTKLQTLSRAP